MATSNVSQGETATQIAKELFSRHSLCVNQQWLLKFLSTVKMPLPPLPVLASTAHFRLLNSDITKSLAASPTTQMNAGPPAVFPANVSDVNNKSSTLPTNVPVQVLTITDIGASKVAQIEAIERYERGEEVRGREVIRNVPIMNEITQLSSSNTNANAPNSGTTTGPTASTVSVKRSQGPHKLILQDAQGMQVHAFESTVVPKLFITNTAEEGGICIGCKLLLKRGCLIRRGLIMLKPDDVVVLGGKVDDWDVSWRKGRKERLSKEVKDEYESAKRGGDEMEE